MLKLLESGVPRSVRRCAAPLLLRSVRPSLLDPRFTGDPWVMQDEDGSASVRLDDYRLVRIDTSPLDLPYLNQLLFQLRQWQMRRRRHRRTADPISSA